MWQNRTCTLLCEFAAHHGSDDHILDEHILEGGPSTMQYHSSTTAA